MFSNKKSSGVWGLAKELAAMLIVLLFFKAFIIQPTIVRGESMVPTLQGGEMVIVSKWYSYLCEPKRGDVVIVHPSNEEQTWIKRIIGLSGDRIKIVEGKVYLNGKLLEEPYINSMSSKASLARRNMSEVIVPEDSIFVMGDNRDHSKDSRYVGPIPKDKIRGRADFIIYPFNEWGSL